MPFVAEVSATSTVTDVRSQLLAAGQYALELRARPADQRGDTYEADVKSAIDAINFLDPVETALTRAAAPVPEVRGPRAAFEQLEQARVSPGREFTEGEGYAAFSQRGGRGTYEAEVRTLLLSENTDPGAGIWRPVGSPTLQTGTIRQQRLFVRDVLSVQSTGLSSIPYIRELNAATNEGGAQMTAEASAKAEVTMQFEQADAPVRKITAWLPATTEILADAPTLRGYIDNRLAYMILLREEAQVLAGDGNAPNLEGVTVVTGKQTQAAVNNDVPATVGLAISKIELVDGEADAVAINPGDYWAAMTTRHSTQFDMGFGGMAPAQQEAFLWGLRAIRTRALASLTSVVGSWRLGATLFQREGVAVTVSDSHSDYFVFNKVAIKGEERVALAIHRPDFFVVTTLDITA